MEKTVKISGSVRPWATLRRPGHSSAAKHMKKLALSRTALAAYLQVCSPPPSPYRDSCRKCPIFFLFFNIFRNIWPLAKPNIAKKGGLLQKLARDDRQTQFGTLSFGVRALAGSNHHFFDFLNIVTRSSRFFILLRRPRAWAPGLGLGPAKRDEKCVVFSIGFSSR